MKRCSVCGADKPPSAFPRNKRKKDGRDGRCSACNRAAVGAWRRRDPARTNKLQRASYHRNSEGNAVRRRAYYEANKGAVNSASKRWAVENPDRRRQIKREYYERNRERVADYAVQWRAANSERVRAAQRAWKAANRGKVAMDNARRRHGCGPGDAEYAAVVLWDPCVYCGAPAGAVDHIVPLSRGGENRWTNLTAACKSCNSSKHAEPLLVWMASRWR